MIVDCDDCEVRGDACGDCVITALLGAPPGGVELVGTERQALDTLASAGLVPRLRLVSTGDADRQNYDVCHEEGSTAGRYDAKRSSTDGERSDRRVG